MTRSLPSFAALIAFASLALASTGCYRVTVKSGLPEAPVRPAINSATRGGYFNGIFENDPVHGDGVCSGGWSSVHIETGFLSGLVDAVRGVYYHVDNVTLHCAPDAPKATPAVYVPPNGAPPAAGTSPAAPNAPAPAPVEGSPPPVAPVEPAPVNTEHL